MKIEEYKLFLDWGTRQGATSEKAKSRYVTMKFALENVPNESAVVELGTTRSFVHGELEGCNSDDIRYWDPGDPSKWDWGAGFFTRIAAESLANNDVTIHTVDICRAHLERCKIITKGLPRIEYHESDSVSFILSFTQKSWLIYLDTGDMTPIEPTAIHQLEEAKAIVAKGIIPVGGMVLIDDVRNATPQRFGDDSGLGKAKYSISYLENNGFEIVLDEYQVLLRRTK